MDGSSGPQGDNGSDVNSMLACFWLSSLDSRRNSESGIGRGLKGWERWAGRVCIFIDSLADFATILIIIISVINQFIPLTITLRSPDYLIEIFEGREREEGRGRKRKKHFVPFQTNFSALIAISLARVSRLCSQPVHRPQNFSFS